MNCSGNKGFTLIYGKYRKAFPVGNYESERSREISMRASGLSAQFISEHRGARRETPLFFQLPSGQGGTRREQRNPVAQHHGEYAQLHFVNQVFGKKEGDDFSTAHQPDVFPRFERFKPPDKRQGIVADNPDLPGSCRLNGA